MAGEEPSIYNVLCVNDIPVSTINIATETHKHTILVQVCEYEYAMAGWPNYVSNGLKLYNEARILIVGLSNGYSTKFQHVLLK